MTGSRRRVLFLKSLGVAMIQSSLRTLICVSIKKEEVPVNVTVS